MKSLEEGLKVFSPGQLQNFKTIAKLLIRLNISLKQYVNYINQKNITIKAKIHKSRKCPICSMIMNRFPVNTNPGNQTGDNSTCVWICPRCWYDEFLNG